VVQQGYINAANDSLIFVIINANNAGVTVQGNYPSGSSGTYKGCFQVRNDGPGTLVSGIRFIGHTNYAGGYGNIQSEDGSLKSTNNVMDGAVHGKAPFTETGTQSNASWNAAHPRHGSC
jgi:hypothetical protein